MLHWFKGTQTTVLESCECVLSEYVFITGADECRLGLLCISCSFVWLWKSTEGCWDTGNILWTFSLCCCVEVNNSLVITWWLVAQLLNQGGDMEGERGGNFLQQVPQIQVRYKFQYLDFSYNEWKYKCSDYLLSLLSLLTETFSLMKRLILSQWYDEEISFLPQTLWLCIASFVIISGSRC